MRGAPPARAQKLSKDPEPPIPDPLCRPSLSAGVESTVGWQDGAVLHLGSCPDSCGGQGLVGPVVTSVGELVLMCDECDAVWLKPSNVGSDQVIHPRQPGWEVAPGLALQPGTTRWAGPSDIEALDWQVDWQVVGLQAFGSLDELLDVSPRSGTFQLATDRRPLLRAMASRARGPAAIALVLGAGLAMAGVWYAVAGPGRGLLGLAGAVAAIGFLVVGERVHHRSFVALCPAGSTWLATGRPYRTLVESLGIPFQDLRGWVAVVADSTGSSLYVVDTMGSGGLKIRSMKACPIDAAHLTISPGGHVLRCEISLDSRRHDLMIGNGAAIKLPTVTAG